MKIIDDTLKSRSKWSAGRLTMLVTFIANVVMAVYSTIKTGTVPDLPQNWGLLIGAMYGINKAGQVSMVGKIKDEQGS